MARPPTTFPGDRYGRLLVLREREEHDYGQRSYECECECGTVVVVAGRLLRSGHKKSCGCLTTPHGRAGSREYGSWTAMKSRVLNPNVEHYARYGGRGIRICVRFHERFEDFFEDLGDRPTPTHSIDRIDNEAHYSCGKCDECRTEGWTANLRWATREEQMANRTPVTHCRRGHPFSPENTYVAPGSGKRACRICRVAYAKKASSATRKQQRGQITEGLIFE